MSEGIQSIAEATPPVHIRSDGTFALEIDRAIFSMDALLRAAYRFTDRSHIFIQTHNTRSDRWLVVIRSKDGHAVPVHLAGEFANELIDQRLRERLEQQFADVRTLIVAQAFAEGNLFDADRGDAECEVDPQGIGRLRP